MNKTFLIPFILSTIVGFGCGERSADSANSIPSNSTGRSSSTTSARALTQRSSSNTGGGGGGGIRSETDQSVASNDDISLKQVSSSQSNALDRKIIRNADISIECDQPREVEKRISLMA